MQFRLWHGRKSPDEDLEDWGFDGPILNDVESFESIYNATNTIRFLTEEACRNAQQVTGWPSYGDLILEIPGTTELIETREPTREHIPAYYGKWLLFDSAMIPTHRIEDMRLVMTLLERLEARSKSHRQT